jgi:transposase
MEEALNRVVSQPTEAGLAEERMLGADLVREMLARKERGEGAKRIARELGVDRKTVKRWLRLGRWQPRRSGHRPRPIERFTEFIEKRAPEVGWNGVVLHRELMGLGFTGTYQQVQRFLQPYRAKRKWSELATVRFETEPGEQAPGRLWPAPSLDRRAAGDGPSVRVYAGLLAALVHARYRNERLATLLDGHERALRHFGGVTLSCLYDNPRSLVLGRNENKVLWHPLFEDFARYYGCSPSAQVGQIEVIEEERTFGSS